MWNNVSKLQPTEYTVYKYLPCSQSGMLYYRCLGIRYRFKFAHATKHFKRRSSHTYAHTHCILFSISYCYMSQSRIRFRSDHIIINRFIFPLIFILSIGILSFHAFCLFHCVNCQCPMLSKMLLKTVVILIYRSPFSSASCSTGRTKDVNSLSHVVFI